MNSVQTRHHSRIWLVVLLAASAAVSCLAQLPAVPRYEGAVSAFHDALFRATADRDGFGRSAIDLYWTADGLAGFEGSRKEFNTKLAALYEKIAGGHIARAELTPAGWKVVPPAAPLVLASGQPCDILLIITNSTEAVQEVVASLVGSAGEWHENISLAAGQAVALYPRLAPKAVGQLDAEVRLDTATSGEIRLTGEVRPPVHLRVRVLDAAGRSTAARVYLHGPDGRSYTPTNSFDRMMWMTGEHFFYTPGEMDVVLPAGAASIEVRKGFEYRPAFRHLEIAEGRDSTIDIRLEWLRDMARVGWLGGDDHIHNNYAGAPEWSTPENAQLVVSAEGLHVGNMMVSNGTGNDVHDERYFEGKLNKLSTADELLYWNQEMRTWSYGHLVLLGLKSLVRPIYTGFPGTPNWEDYPSNYDQAQQARRQGGVVLYAHPALRFDDFPTGSLAGEAVADVALGGIDALEVFCSHDEPSMELWYRFLNLGFHLGISGGSDAFLNNRFAFLAGGERVYVYTREKLTYSGWLDALRQGRAFATVGPLLTFTVAGHIAGSELRFASSQKNLPVHIDAVSTIPMTRMEIVSNGRVVAVATSAKPTDHMTWSGTIEAPQSAWVAARVWGPNNDRIANGPSRWSQRRSPDLALLAHTGPVYVRVGDIPVFSSSDHDFCLRWIDELTARISKDGKFSGDQHRQEILALFARARQVYERMGAAREGD